MDKCEQMTVLLSAWLDGELTAAEEQELQVHLRECASCRQVMEELKAISGAMRSMEEVEPPADLKERILEEVHRSGASAAEASAALPGGRRRRASMITSVACVAVVLVGALGLGRLGLPFSGGEESAPAGNALEEDVAVTAYSAMPQESAKTVTVNDGNMEFCTTVSATPMPETQSQTQKVMPDENAITALLLCYGVEGLPVVPGYLLEETGGSNLDYPSWLCPAEHLHELVNLLEQERVTTAVEYSPSYAGLDGEWIRVAVAP